MSDTARSGVSCANQAGTDLHRPGRRLGQRLRHQPRDRLRRRAVQRRQGGRHARGLARPQRHQGQRHVVPGAGRPGRRQRLLRRRRRPTSATARTTPASSPRSTSSRTRTATASSRPRPGGSSGDNETGGMNEATGDIFGALTEAYAANPNDPADFTVGEEADLVGDGPIRYMYNPSIVGDPNCWSSQHQEHRGARGRRPAEPLVLPAVPGLGRLPGQPHLQRLDRSPASASRPPARSSTTVCC